MYHQLYKVLFPNARRPGAFIIDNWTNLKFLIEECFVVKDKASGEGEGGAGSGEREAGRGGVELWILPYLP
jgi:hypothetical protein